MTQLTKVAEYEAKKGRNYQGQPVAAINIRKELKAFAGIKFSVRQDGNAINIRWTDGPTCAQVDSITKKYQKGSFNGMIDLYENDYAEFNEVYGGAKWISTQRINTASALKVAGEMTAKEYGVSAPEINAGTKSYGAYYEESNVFVTSNSRDPHWNTANVSMRTLRDLAFTPEGEAIIEEAAEEAIEEAAPVVEETATEEHAEPVIEVVEVVEIHEGAELFVTGVKFPHLNKRDWMEDYYSQIPTGNYATEEVKVIKQVTLTDQGYKNFCHSLLTTQDWLAGLGGHYSIAQLPEVQSFDDFTLEQQTQWQENSYAEVIAVMSDCTDDPVLYINPEGYSYARYVGVN
jgi:hypothetical protein